MRYIPAWCLPLLLFSTVVSAQPRLTALLPSDTVPAGEPFTLRLEVRWAGRPEQYLLYPPKLELPEGVSAGALRQSFVTRADETISTYDYTLTADHPGTIPLGTITLDYREVGPGAAQSETGSGSEPLKEEAPTLHVTSGGAKGVFGRALVGILLMGLLSLVWMLRRRHPRALSALVDQRPTVSPASLVAEVRQALVDGNHDRAYMLLQKLKPLLPPAEDPLPSQEQLEAERLRLRYGGVSGDRHELERLVRAVDRVVGSSSA